MQLVGRKGMRRDGESRGGKTEGSGVDLMKKKKSKDEHRGVEQEGRK